MSELPLEQQPSDPLPIQENQSKKKLILVAAGIVLLLVIVAALVIASILRNKPVANTAHKLNSDSNSSQTTAKSAQEQGLQLDPNKNYGNKYANGILPVGDNQYTTSSATKGKVYLCNNNFVPAGQAGAQTRGPWFIGTTQWDINKKISVSGKVNWTHIFSNKIQGDKRVISSNDLPNHFTGIFPVQSSDKAYSYDRNPNTIKSQDLTYNLTANPTYGSPQCMGGEVGVMLTGVALFNGFDAGGRDAGAWEVQDGCQGHPQGTGIYHYHTLSACITDVSVSTVIGFALDGFPITGPKIGTNNYLTTSNLDECHGITSEVTLDGKKVKTYHYVMTQDFPYSASCFRATAIQSPGQHSGGQNNQQGSQSQQQSPPSGMPPPRQ